MYEWNEAVQKIIDWIEDNICDDPSLIKMSEHIGYSPWYCSVKFHEITGMTIKSYISGRRLALAALAIRDTKERLIDIAVKFGYSSQEALTRAFSIAFGCTPAAYRKAPIPVPMSIKQVVFLPEHYHALKVKGESSMSNNLIEANVRIEFIPSHKYIGIWDDKATNYGEFWKNHDGDTVCGIINSLSNVSDIIITGHTAGWQKVNGEHKYFYGTGVSADYIGKIPDGFEMREFPESYYLVFFHPSYDYLKDNGEVMGRVEALAWNYDIEKEMHGKYIWNEDACQCYQRHYPEVIGYEILRPIRLR